MGVTRIPTARLRRLAAELRRLRDAAGLTQDQVVQRTGISKASLSRIENAGGRPLRQSLISLLDLYKADDAERSWLLTLRTDADKVGWLTSFRDVLPDEYATFIQFETEAAVISNYEEIVVPGLLQTSDYADAIIRATKPGLTETERTKRVEARMARQERLKQASAPNHWVIIDEAALRRQVGNSDVMRAQRARIIEDAGLPNVTLQVIPFSAGAHAGMAGSYILLDFPKPDPSVVYLEGLRRDVILDDADDVSAFKENFDMLRMTALSHDQSIKMIAVEK